MYVLTLPQASACTSGRCSITDECHPQRNVIQCHARQLRPACSLPQRHVFSAFTTCYPQLRAKRNDRLRVHAGNQPSRLRQTQQIPIFPLGLVAMPHTTVPLNIFEARYRVLFSTLLAGDEGIEEGLVNNESPFRATRKFGINLVHQSGLVQIGTLLKIEQHKRLPDGQIVIVSKGIQRYKLTKVVKEQPVLIAEVELLPEDDDTGEQARQLAADVCNTTKSLLELNMKMRKLKVSKEDLNPPELSDINPTRLSYFVASLLLDNYEQQQALLIEDSTVKRLTIEKEILETTLKYMSARFAVQGAFAPSTEQGPPNP